MALTEEQLAAAIAHVENELSKTPHAQKLGDGTLIKVLVPILLDWFGKNIPNIK